MLMLGSGAIQIGQAGEFDYSGSQAIKAMRAEGVRTILVNPNIATVQTSAGLADRVYFLPLSPDFVERVIEREKPDGLLMSFGGQTALDTGLALAGSGFLERHGVRVLGTPVEAVIDTEDRERFAARLGGIGVKVPRSRAVSTTAEALSAAEEIGYPVMCRIAFALGGLGSGVAGGPGELSALMSKALTLTGQVLVEEYLAGWKELEYEVVRDRRDNCIVVCSMENMDPMGIHTGESVVVAPVQTLDARESFLLRSLSIRIARHLGIVGECNIQFAFDPIGSDYRVIEVNARLSRSSALASKATGYPLAEIAARLALGRDLTEVENRVTGCTTACFEPAMDYVVVKMPRWDLDKFRKVSRLIGSEMKSVGEVMAVGRSFEEALQKAVRMLDCGTNGLSSPAVRFDSLEAELAVPTDRRPAAIAEAFRSGWTVDRVHSLCRIDKWFLWRMASIVETEERIAARPSGGMGGDLLREAKCRGFSDGQIAALTRSTEEEVRALRRSLGIEPFVKQIDTMAGEYPAATSYLYMTYNASESDVQPGGAGQVVVLGGGPYRIGSSVEFDWCCVSAARTASEAGRRTILVNCNPETVSTDFDTCDRLYLEELTLERVRDICDLEDPWGVIVSMGGQTPNNLAMPLAEAGIRILGTSPPSIDRAEDRHKFSSLLDRLGIDQPEWRELTSLEDAEEFAGRTGYPVLIRPSYVLSGAAMSIALNDGELRTYLEKAAAIGSDHPVVISRFITGARELEVDAVASGGRLCFHAVSEHVENAGVHSGDATLVIPPQRTYLETIRRVRHVTEAIAAELEITGPFNIQFLARGNEVKVIECNLRASRSFPFVSKVLGVDLARAATLAVLGLEVPHPDASPFDLDHVGVKAPQFSFTRLKGSDPVQGVEMTSTGEVGCLGADFNEAFLKSLLSVGYRVPARGVLVSSGPEETKLELLECISELGARGLHIYATRGTADFLKRHGISSSILHWPLSGREPGCISAIREGLVDLVVNIPKNSEKDELDNDYLIRRAAVDHGVQLITNAQLARRFVEATGRFCSDNLETRSWDEYLGH